MISERVIYSLLKRCPGITALAGTRIYAGFIPQGAALPAIAYNHISTTETKFQRLEMSSAQTIVTSRIEVAVQTKDYSDQKELLAAVRAACRNKQGQIAGVTVHSVLADTVGPDLRDDEASIYMQTIDFRVSYQA